MLSLVVVGCNLNYNRGGASVHPYFDTHFVVCVRTRMHTRVFSQWFSHGSITFNELFFRDD